MPAQTWIKSALKERGLKLKDVAAALGITPPRVTDIVKGMREVQSDEVTALATLLGMSTKSLLASLKAGALTAAGRDETAPLLPIIGGLTGTGNIEQTATGALTGVPAPPDAETDEGLSCYVMADDSLTREIRKGSLIIAGDPRIHFMPMVPGAIFIIDLGEGRLTGRQYMKTDNGEHWLIPLSEQANPLYESYRFSMLSADMDMGAKPNGDDRRIIRPDDIAGIVMWVHRRFTPDEAA